MDYLRQLAQQAVDVLQANVGEAEKALLANAAGTVATGAAAVWSWIKKKLTKPAAVAVLKETIDNPEEPENWEALGTQIVKAIKDDPAAVKELSALLDNVRGPTQTTQTATVSGRSNVVAQVNGKRNRVNIGNK